MKKLLSHSIFKKAAAFILSLCMLVYLIPDINFEVHAADFTATLAVGQEWEKTVADFFGEECNETHDVINDNFGGIIIKNPNNSNLHIYLGNDTTEDYVSTFQILGTERLRFTSDVAGTYTFTVDLYKDFGDTYWKTRTVELTFYNTVTFDKNGGTAEADPKTKNVSTLGGNVGTLPTAPTKSGYTFAGWNTAANGSGTTFDAATAVTKDITVYAKWTAASSPFTFSDIDSTTTVVTGYTGTDATVTIPDKSPTGNTVIRIAYQAFMNNSTLENVTIPSTVTEILGNAFYNNANLKTINIPSSITTINTGTFSLCKKLDTVTIENSVTVIADSAFQDCTALKSITIPSSVTSIGDSAFYNSGLTSINIPKNVITIGNGSFDLCSSLSAITVDSDNTKFCAENGVLYNKDKTTLIQYPGGKTDTTFTVPDSVTTIGYAAFDSCKYLTELTLPSNVTTLGDYAFYTDSNVLSVPVLSKIYFKGAAPTTIGTNCFVGSTSSITIYCTASECTNSFDSDGDGKWNGCTVVAPTTYTVSFNSDGGSSTPDSQTIASGQKATAPTGITKNHYDLDGWYDGETKWDFNNKPVTENVALKAKWTLHPYDIHYELYGGTNDPANPTTCDYEHGFTFKPATKSGSIFGGWYLEPTFEHIIGAFTVNAISNDVTIYAKWIADATKPTVSSLSVPANKTYKTGDVLNFTVNFSETVNVTGTPVIPITIGSTTCYASYVSGTGTSALVFRYTVQSGDNDSDGIAVDTAIDLNIVGTINDAANNGAVLTLNNKPSTSGILIDNVGPIMVGVNNPVDKTYKLGDNLYFIFNYNENVNVVTTGGTPSIELVIGNTTRYANYVDGSGSASLIFRYTVQNNDADSDGIKVNPAIRLNGGTIKDSAGNGADTLFAEYSLTGVLVDAAAPAAPSTLDLTSGSDTGSSSTDNLTKNTTPTFTGTAEAGSTVKLYDTDGTTQIGSATATGGSWTITSSTLSEGTHSITAKSTDAAGNISVASSALSVKIDITPPTRNDVTDGQIFATPISFLSLGGTAELTKDTDAPVPYTSGAISDSGSYVLKITDTAGNIYSVSFTIAIPTVPSAPQNLTVTPGNVQAEVTFDPPADNGGAEITLYRLKIVRVSNNGIQLLYPNSSPCTAVSLINGEEYKFSIAAVNIAGTGAYSSEITARIGRTGKSIVSTTIGDLLGGNIINVPYGTTVSAFKAGLTVSDGASAEINTSIGHGAVANQDTTIVTSSMIILVRAENGISDEHTITVNSAKYTVLFNSNGGTAIADLANVVSGSKITAPTAPKRSNYTFKGWYKESSLTNVWNFATDTVTSNIALYAKWTAVPKYTVAFNSNSGTAVADLTNVVSGSKITAPTAPTRDNFTFGGWYKDAGLTEQWNFATDTVTSNITLFAKWEINASTPAPAPTSTEPPATSPPAQKPTITVKETPQNVPSPELISAQPVGDPFDKSVEVRLKDNPKVKEEVQKALESSDTKLPENAKIFPLDISMYVTGTDTKVQPKDGTAVEITCPVPKELLSDKDDLFVVCVVDGKLHILPVKIVMKNGVPCAVFTATHFSPYAFVIDKDGKLSTLAAGEPTLENASPLSHHNGILYIVLSIGLIAGIVIFKRRKAK